MKTVLLTITSCILAGCSSLDHFVCYGAGTCEVNGSYSASAANWVSPTPNSIITNSGTYQITRNQSSGAIMSINRVSGGKYKY